MEKRALNDRIRSFYNQSTQLWLDTWGRHMHHGYYGTDGKTKKNAQQAQIDMIEEMLRWGKVDNAMSILDAGCGVGGSAIYLARRFGATARGCTLSDVQCQEAQALISSEKLTGKVIVERRDMMTLTPEDGPFDLIWSMESAEHICDKRQLLEKFYSLLVPGGTLLMATWCCCHNPPASGKKEEKLLAKIGAYYHLPPMISVEEYQTLAHNVGFEQVQTSDWSEAVSPFWMEVIRSAFRWRSAMGLIRSGWATIRGAWAMQYMTRGYKLGIIQYGVIQGRKP